MVKKMISGMAAPDFELVDTNDRKTRLSDFNGQKYVVLAFNRGFS